MAAIKMLNMGSGMSDSTESRMFLCGQCGKFYQSHTVKEDGYLKSYRNWCGCAKAHNTQEG